VCAETRPRNPATLTVPTKHDDPEAPSFPWLAALAPLGVTAILWAVTHSPYTAIFAVLSPLVATASFLDSYLQRKRKKRRIHAQYRLEVNNFTQELDDLHARERRAAWACLRAVGTEPVWGALENTVLHIVVGVGSRVSSVTVTGGSLDDEAKTLAEQARCVSNAPITIDANRTLVLVGLASITSAVARYVLLQYARLFSVNTVMFRLPDSQGWSWAKNLPHVLEYVPVESDYFESVEVWATISDKSSSAGGNTRVIATITCTTDEKHIPIGWGAVLRMNSIRSAELTVAGESECVLLKPSLVSAHAAANMAHTLAVRATQMTPSRVKVVPEFVTRQQLRVHRGVVLANQTHSGKTHSRAMDSDKVDDKQVYSPAMRGGLPCLLGLSADGPFMVDLVRDGTHAIVAGTTGSGKSELLVSWIVGIAQEFDPSQFTVLLVDFKGGASFGPLTELPHCVGLITDLGPVEARRALESIRAELRYRESQLAVARVRHIDDLPATMRLARLVIVVDEFQVMLQSFPDLCDVFLDVAARGRSLGIHAILCTQRPSGVIPEALFANCGLRICLRVHDRSDSSAVVGDASAWQLPSSIPGRSVIRRDSEVPVVLTDVVYAVDG
jgi:S-DNA-T family DNA segregation ATPase FtsK/SpoIIIE